MKFYPDFFVSRKNSTKFEFDPSVLYGNTTLAESVLVFSLIILLVVDSANERERNWFYLIPTTGLLTSMVILLLNWGEESTKILLGSLQIDSFVRIFQFLIALCSLLCIPLSMRYLECVEMPMTEFMTFLLTATIGGMFLCGANDLVTIFVCLECLSLCSYLLCGYAKRDVRSNEAAMKFLLVGGTSSSILAYGFSWIYGLSGGEIQLQKIVDGLSSTQMFNSAGSSLAIVCIVVGIAFKLSLVPFHQWTPDVYEGPTPVVAFLSVVSKIAGLALITRIFYVVFTPSPDEWKPMLEVLAISSMVLGNSVALTQKSMKRMLAYSSISQMGYLSIGLITGGFAGCSSMIIYIFFYIFMNIGTFACIISFSSRTGTDNIRDYSGLYIKDPLLTFSSSSCLSSLGGIPPLTGFFGKLYPFRCGWRAGFHPLVLAGLATSIISIYYYLQIVKLLITGRDGGFNYYARTHAIISNKSTAKSYLEPSMIFCALTSIFLGLFINPIIDLVRYNLDRLIFLIG